MAAFGRHIFVLLLIRVWSQELPPVQAQSQPALRGTSSTFTDPVIDQHNVSMEELLSDNETLSAIDAEMEDQEMHEVDILPVEYEPENTTEQDQDQEDLEVADMVDAGAPSQRTTKSRAWWSMWYGYKYYGRKNQHNVCPAGGYLKSMKMVFGTTPFNTGVIRVEEATCSNGKRFGAEGGKAPGIPSTFFSNRGFGQVLIFSGYSIRGICLGGKCAGTSGNRFKIRCRKGRVLAGYRTSTSKRMNALKFFCRSRNRRMK